MMSAMSTSSRPRAFRRVTAWGLLVLMVLGWWAFLRPASMGGPLTFITVSGVSMEPRLHTDDLAVMYQRDSYAAGDVVAFRSSALPDQPAEGAFVIHRIKGGNGADGFVMRGDNNDWDDPWTPTTDEVAGEMIFSVPGAGAAMRWITQPFNLASIAAAVTAALIAAGGSGRKHDSEVDDDVEHAAREEMTSR
jgi:signal peptidase I